LWTPARRGAGNRKPRPPRLTVVIPPRLRFRRIFLPWNGLSRRDPGGGMAWVSSTSKIRWKHTLRWLSGSHAGDRVEILPRGILPPSGVQGVQGRGTGGPRPRKPTPSGGAISPPIPGANRVPINNVKIGAVLACRGSSHPRYPPEALDRF
jgi:hypothetical protein